MLIKILGPGCPKCHELDKRTREVVKQLGVTADIERVTDVKEIMEFPILTTPGLVINEELVFSGRVPTRAEITGFVTAARDKE
jgi:small redox-active disulfide protein 2